MDSNTRKLFGQRIKAKREELGLSQTELAKAVHKSSPTYIAFIESGDRNVSAMDLMLIAKNLKTTVSELMGEKNNQTTEVMQVLRADRNLSPTARKKVEDFYMFVREKDENNSAEPRYNYAQSEAINLWKNLINQQIPVMLNDIVQAMGIRVIEKDMPKELHSDGVSQMDSNGNCTIMYRSDISEERKRFTVAHEIGHIVLEHISFDGSSSQCSMDSQEKEANAFAGALLVPVEDLKKFMKNGNKTIDDITSRYRVSKNVANIAIMGNRLLNKIKIC